MNAETKVNILMVDDQPAKLLSYEVILSDLGENLIKATSASEARRRYRRASMPLLAPEIVDRVNRPLSGVCYTAPINKLNAMIEGNIA